MLLPGESQGLGSLVGCPLWGRTESDTTEATEQQQQQWYAKYSLDLLWFILHVNLTGTQDAQMLGKTLFWGICEGVSR